MSAVAGWWEQHQELYRAILELPFNRELAAGTLGRERFAHYMIQDAHYLGMFARALALAAARAPEPDEQVQLAGASRDAILVERGLHEGFFKEFGIGTAEWRASPPSPTCFAYGQFLVATAATASYPVALAALLPCFQIYWEVGRELYHSAVRPNPYQRWIDTYADESFGAAVRAVIGFTDRAHAAAGSAERAAMAEAWRTSARLEWLFWDAAYRLERWPV
jgi:thiaminase/transcriptional activator TenA